MGRALLAKSVEYVKQRTQFGKPIGSFQAVKHHLASVHVALELARPLVYGAALNAVPVSAAKITAGDAAHKAARSALQSTAPSATPSKTTSAYGYRKSVRCTPPGEPDPSTVPTLLPPSHEQPTCIRNPQPQRREVLNRHHLAHLL
ncbi:acyl-CoA dehydrogenase family protein [Kibdelosporangium philippinense]|uniref:acyl-CoA dehydrogenase family protein n=1 Tax=Kibdelosporangium philippinense TaxID=211113 RepID=UPI00360679AC